MPGQLGHAGHARPRTGVRIHSSHLSFQPAARHLFGLQAAHRTAQIFVPSTCNQQCLATTSQSTSPQCSAAKHSGYKTCAVTLSKIDACAR
jgi:hypothetical protein